MSHRGFPIQPHCVMAEYIPTRLDGNNESLSDGLDVRYDGKYTLSISLMHPVFILLFRCLQEYSYLLLR